MTPPRKNLRIAVATATIALAAAGAAVAATKLHGSPSAAGPAAPGAFVSSGSGAGTAPPRFRGRGGPGAHGDELAAAATYLGVSQSSLTTQLEAGKTLGQIADGTSGKSKAGLIDALVAAEKQELAAAVSAGRLTQAQADQLTKGLVARFTALVDGTRPPFGHGGPGFGHGGDDLAAAASYLGISQTALITQLGTGKTLAQVADATSGKSKAGLIDALVAHEQAELAQAVKDGRLTQAQADQIESGLTARVTARVDGTGGPFGGHDHGFGGPPPAQPGAGSGTGSAPPTHI